MTITKSSVEIRLGSLPLRVLTGQNGELLWNEETLVGSDVLNPADGERFTDVFNTWHKGGFIAEHVQEGFYYEAINVDCTKPGEIRPAPRRITQMTFAPGAGKGCYGVSGLAFDSDLNELLAITKHDFVPGSDVPDALRSYWVTSAHAQIAEATNDVVIASDADDKTDGAATGMTNQTPVLEFLRGGSKEYIVPYGSSFRPLTSGALGPDTAKKAHQIIVAGGRLFAVSLTVEGFVEISNCDQNAAYTTPGNWTTPVVLPTAEAPWFQPTGVSIVTVQGVPYIGTSHGLFALTPGGIPANLTPASSVLPVGLGNWAAMVATPEGILSGQCGPGHLALVTNSGGRLAFVGPSMNPLAVLDTAIIQHIQVNSKGDWWVLVWYPSRSGADRSWEMWVGVRQPDGSRAWHPLWANSNANEGGPTTTNWRVTTSRRPFLPIYFNSGGTRSPEIALGTGASVNANKLLFLNGGLFYNETPSFESGSGGYTVIVQWRSGRYSRHDPRSSRHWMGGRLRGKNIGAAGALGGRIRVEVSYDGGAFADPPGGAAVYLTSNSQYVSLNSQGKDVELRLTWQLDGVSAAVMQATPATVTQIALEGREVPTLVRRITCVVSGENVAQAGGVRRKQTPATVMDAIEAQIDDGNVTVVDVHKESRTVAVLPSTQLTHQECRAFGVPAGSVQLALLEVPSA